MHRLFHGPHPCAEAGVEQSAPASRKLFGVVARAMKTKGGGVDWAANEAPSLAELEELAHSAYRQLPARFRKLTGEVLIRVEDFPTDETLDSVGIESPFDLLGLYSGVD